MSIGIKESKKRVEQLSSVEDPQRVKVLILTDQKTIYSDFYFINRFVNIVKLDLSYNKLSSFPVGFTFGTFPLLIILFLHYNKFASIKSVQIVNEGRKLEYLTLFGNPLQQTKTRHYFVNQIQSLKLMDDKIIKMQQRNPQAMINLPSQLPKLSFPIVTVIESQGSTHFLSAVISQLRLIRQKYLIANPIIVIQRWYRKTKLKQRKKEKAAQIAQQNKIQQQIEDVLSEYKPVTVEKPIQRLITEKLEIHTSKQQKVLSILQMNLQFLSTIRQMSTKKVFALKSFCQAHKIKYQQTGEKMLCLRVPSDQDHNDSRGQLQLILKSSQKYLLRRIGSQEAMGLRKKYKIIANLIKKRKKRQPLYFNRIIDKQQNLNTLLLQKIKNIQKEYKDRFVLVTEQPSVIYKHMREHYYKCLNSRKPFPFCVQEIMQRSAAAVSIQRMWRGYKVRKQFHNSYRVIAHIHATWFIQRYIRNLGFYKRSSMFNQIIIYSKKQANINKIIVPMSEVTTFQSKRNQICNGINFTLPDQHFDFVIDYDQSVCIINDGKLALPPYIAKYLKIVARSIQSDNSNILDLLFKGAKSIKYFSFTTSADETSKVSVNQGLAFSASKSKITLSNSIASISKSKVKQQKNRSQNGQSYAIIEYETNEETLRRKIMLALASYRFMNNSYIRSQKFIFKLNASGIKDISQRVKNTYAIAKFNQQKQVSLIESENRQKSNPSKLKYFSQSEDFTIKAQAYFAVNDSLVKREESLKLKLQNLQNGSSIGDYSHRKSIHANPSNAHIANISRTILTMPQNQELSSNSNFMSYCEQQQKVKRSKYYRYYEQTDKETHKKSLQKCQSLQPTSRKQADQQIGPHFITLNRTVQKSYESQANLHSLADRLSARLKPYDKISGTWDVQSQIKKEKIQYIKSAHKQKIQENNRYKKQQLTKLRQKFNDQIEIQAKILQSSKLQGALSNVRKHNMVKRALAKRVEDVQAFQRDFFKRGNSSIRKDMIKFQHDRSIKSPDNESIYESIRSLQTEAMKNQLLKRGKNIFNLKTQIKQFSIAGSDIDPDMSLGAINMEISSKVAHRKRQEQKNDDLEIKKQKVESARRAQSHKRDIKKKKVVHSVFPEQFYPLKESKKLGFELPKIKK